MATFDWPIRTTAHVLKHFAFRSEFRPLGILQLVNFHLSHFSTEETLPTLAWGLWLCFVLWVLCFGVWLCSGLVFSPPPTCSVSILLMITWAHRPHGVRTRGKKASTPMWQSEQHSTNTQCPSHQRCCGHHLNVWQRVSQRSLECTLKCATNNKECAPWPSPKARTLVLVLEGSVGMAFRLATLQVFLHVPRTLSSVLVEGEMSNFLPHSPSIPAILPAPCPSFASLLFRHVAPGLRRGDHASHITELLSSAGSNTALQAQQDQQDWCRRQSLQINTYGPARRQAKPPWPVSSCLPPRREMRYLYQRAWRRPALRGN